MSLVGDLLGKIIHSSDVYFDPSETNNSLYLCFPQETPAPSVNAVVDRLRTSGAWHGERRAVPADKKQTYAESLAFEECFAIDAGGCRVLVLRASHPRFPSRPASWEAWRRNLLAV